MLHCPKCGRHYSNDVRECPEDGSPLKADATVPFTRVADPLIQKVLDGKYRLEELIGEGGMGAVYRATHLLIERSVAVKVLNTRFVEDEAAKARFHREARAAGRLQHVNAVAVTDFGSTADGLVYIVMELLEGRSLRDVLAREAPLDQARAVSLMLQISAAVAAAHESGIIHRDLKPANIFIQQRRHAPPIVKVLDFGIAKLAADSVEEGENQTITQTGVMIGTPRYMSPEQCESGDLSSASDVYGLGIILYEMLTGITPFGGSSPLAVAMKHSGETPRPPREVVPSIAREVERVVLHALEKNPQARPHDAGQFRRELFSTAQKLGLEHSLSGSHSLSSLVSAGVRSNSGRLVVDIERLRSDASNTGQIVARESTGGRNRETIEEPLVVESPERVVSASPGKSDAARDGSQFSRVRVDLPSRRPWYFRPLAWVAGAAAFVLVIFIGTASYKQSRSYRTEPIARPEPTAEMVSPAPGSSPDSSPGPSPEATGPIKGQANEAIGTNERSIPRAERAVPRTNPKQAQKESKVKSLFKKAGRLFKNPF
jgi:serine/threonine-protein kinase